MNIFCHEEAVGCSEYSADANLGFRYIEVEQGTLFSVTEKREKHLLFFLEGSVIMRYNEFSNREFTAGEMIFLPKSADCYGEALTKCCFIVHIYDAPVRLCDRAGLNTIIGCAEHMQCEFKSLPIHNILKDYLLLLKQYLEKKIKCRHMHEIKQKELFIIFRALYEKEELAQLFHPVLGKSLDFRGKVMTYYIKAKTVRELAGFCQYSEGHFHALFTVEFGESPYKWMQKQKAKHIIGRLSQSGVTLKEVADEFNFSSQSHFNKYCKIQFGESAVQVMRKLKSDNQLLDRKKVESEEYA